MLLCEENSTISWFLLMLSIWYDFVWTMQEKSLQSVYRWWDCIALPDDIDSSDEVSFRMQIKELAFKVEFLRCLVCDRKCNFRWFNMSCACLLILMFQSLQLLKTAIFDKECEPCILTDADLVIYSFMCFPIDIASSLSLKF